MVKNHLCLASSGKKSWLRSLDLFPVHSFLTFLLSININFVDCSVLTAMHLNSLREKNCKTFFCEEAKLADIIVCNID